MFGYLQKIGRSLMIPVAVLPAAALLLGIGYFIGSTSWGANSVIAALLSKSGGALIDNIAVLFAVGIAFGMSNDKNGSAALTGLVGFLVVTTLLAPASVALLMNVPLPAVPAAFAHINNPFIGILVGIISAELYNRFSKVELHKALAFFSGRRLVPIIMSFVMIVLAFILLFAWPYMYGYLVSFGEGIQKLGAVGSGFYGFFNRLLLPLGLHHALNSVFWFDVAGINDIPKFMGGGKLGGVSGITGMYQAGFFPIFMFGLLGACCAFVKTSKPENRAKVASLMLAAGLAAFFTGVTEPVEFSFMFLAPPLYLLHAIFTGLSMYIAAHFHWMAGFGFSAGLFDLILSSQNPLAVHWYMLILQGIVFFFLYYFSFVFLITKFDMKTPGRGDVVNDTMDTVSEKGANKAKTGSSHADIATAILPLLGGKENIILVDYCITRLRLGVKDSSLVEKEELKRIVSGVLVPSKTAVQVIIGPEVEFVAEEFKKLVK
jgi:N-acetylglucosamine PTS system EIICBA or EIICB component